MASTANICFLGYEVMTCRVMVCDDLPEAQAELAGMIREYGARHNIHIHIETASRGDELLELWYVDRWDCVFLDIYMPGMDGIETARSLRQKDRDVSLVFATNSWAHGLVSYELRAMDYLTKPIRQKDVDRALDWFFQTKANDLKEIIIRNGLEETSIRACSIRYIESRGHNCVIHTTTADLTTRCSLAELENELLEMDAFVRCHQSFLVNFAYVEKQEKKYFLIKGVGQIPISAQRFSFVRQRFQNWTASIH